MIREYGMSTTLGQVYLSPEKRPQFLDIGKQEGGDYSEATSEMIDREIREIIAGEYSRATQILQSRRDVLVQGALLLLEKEKIEGSEIKALMV